MTDDVTRPFPHAVGPEKSVLSSILQEPIECMGVALEEGFTEAHFYQPSNQVLFGHLVDLLDAGKPIELVSLVQGMLDRGILEKAGGAHHISSLYTYAVGLGSFRYHLQIVKDKYVQRCMLNMCATTAQEIYDSPEDTERIIDAAESSIMAIRDGRESTKVETIKEATDWVVRDFQDRLNGNCGILGLKTGFEDFDRMTGGLKEGNMVVIAARPSMGKTSFLMNIAENVAVTDGEGGLIFSCEMTRRELTQRLVYSRARFDQKLLSLGHKPIKAELQRIQRSAIDIARSGLFVDDTPAITISQLRAKARRVKRDFESKGRMLRFIGIDYLQLMKSTSKQAQGNREREISEISGGIKGLAKELGIPIIVLAQLNRGPEHRAGQKSRNPGKPRMSDLRESGAIEQDADIVGLLYRTAYYAEGNDEKEAAGGESELDIAKNRNGATGAIALNFIAELSTFETASFADRAPKQEQPSQGWQR